MTRMMVWVQPAATSFNHRKAAKFSPKMMQSQNSIQTNTKTMKKKSRMMQARLRKGISIGKPKWGKTLPKNVFKGSIWASLLLRVSSEEVNRQEGPVPRAAKTIISARKSKRMTKNKVRHNFFTFRAFTKKVCNSWINLFRQIFQNFRLRYN